MSREACSCDLGHGGWVWCGILLGIMGTMKGNMALAYAMGGDTESLVWVPVVLVEAVRSVRFKVVCAVSDAGKNNV